MTWLPWIGLGLCLVAACALGLAAYGAQRWDSAMLALTQRLDASRPAETARPRPTTRYDSRELDGLPAPVQRYFRAVLKQGQPIIEAVTLEHVGMFNMSSAGEQWKPFASTQRVVTRRPGFIWNAKVGMFPGVAVRVLDNYVAGQGQLRAAVLGLVTMANVQGGGEIARGEFMRWFAEAAWYPTALLPSQGVSWEAVDEHSANATVVDGPLSLTLLFGFDDAGLIVSVRAAARGAGVGKDMVMLPWLCALSNYQPQQGMMLPMAGEAAWLRPEGRKAYFRGTVRRMSVEFSRPPSSDSPTPAPPGGIARPVPGPRRVVPVGAPDAS